MLLTDDRQSSVLAKRTIQIGLEVFDRSKALAPSVLNSRWWEERLMQWSMTWPDLKARLFRLVDVLPSLPERSAVLEHLKEYLEEDGELEGGGELGIRNSEFGIKRNSELLSSLHSEFRIPHFRARLLRLVPPLLGSGQTVRGRLSAAAVLRAVRRLAHRFIAGETIDQAIETVVRLRRQQQAFSLDLLGEKVLSEPEADRYAQQYLELIRALTAAAKAWPAEPMLDSAPAGAGTRTLPG